MPITRVQAQASTNYAFTNVTSWTGPAWSPAPTAGNLLLLILSIDKDGGSATPGISSGWTVEIYQNGTQSTILVAWKIATASETPPTVTWNPAVTTAGGANGILLEYSGVATTTPITPRTVAVYSDTATTSLALGPLTATAAGLMLAAFTLDSVAANASMATAFDPAASGWANEARGANGVSGGSGTPGVSLARLSTTLAAGTTVPSTTFTWSTSDQVQGAMFALRESGTAAPATPTLAHRVVGVPSSTTGRVSVRTANAISARLKVGTDTAVTQGVLFGQPATPNAQGDSQLTVTGLTPGVRYYYRIAMTASGGSETLDTAATVGTFKAAPTGQTNFAFCFGSCTNGTDSAALAAVAARGDDLFFHLGDLYYADTSGTSVANFRDKMTAKIQAANHAAVLATTPTTYTPSDHDGMNNNSSAGTDPTAWANWNSVYRELWPTPALPAATGVYYTFTWGRVRFIQLDGRSFKSDPAATDNASKTALGATQKQWLKDTITAAAEPVIVVLQDSPWLGAASAGDDSWLGYTTERAELRAFFKGSGKNVVLLAGDMHAVAAAASTASEVAVFHGAPLNNNASQKGSGYTVGPYPASPSTAVVQQYGRVAVTDTGTQISLAYTGYSSDNTQRVTLTETYSTTVVLDAPTGLTATAVSSAQVDLAWTAVAGATSYDVERDGVVVATGLAGTTYADTGRAPATTYTYRVRAQQA